MPAGPALLRSRHRACMAALLTVTSALACEPPTGDEGTVTVTVRMRLRAETRDMGAAAAAVWIFGGDGAVSRAYVTPSHGIRCDFSQTPVTVCQKEVPRGTLVTLMAAEGEPAILVNFGPPEDADTAHSSRYVEFVRWSGCEEEPERGSCVVDASGDLEVGAEFQYMTQIVVHQIGAARFDYIVYNPLPMLRIPPESNNIINSAGCRGVSQSPPVHCDSVHVVGSDPQRRMRAYVPRATTFELRPGNGTETSFIEWDYPNCAVFEESGCVFPTSSSDTAGTPLVMTFKFEYWQCPAGPSDRDTGGCTLIRP